MTADDVLAYLASRPNWDRPREMRHDAAMLRCWKRLRTDREFYADVVMRHGLDSQQYIIGNKHRHAIGNAWGHCVQVIQE
jgi:hypothetical protein